MPPEQIAAPGSTAPQPTPTPCVLGTATIPTPPAEIPGYAELDPTTGLHVTGTTPEIDFQSYRIEITGRVDNPPAQVLSDAARPVPSGLAALL